MKKLIIVLCVILNVIICINFSAFAGQWYQDNNGWWWCNDDRSYPVNCWQWIDDNNDGVAECYYFNQSGYCLLGTKTPDGYYVNPNGAWIVNGVIQKKSVVSYSSPNGMPYSDGINQDNLNKNNKTMNLASLQMVAEKNAYVKDAYETMLDGAFGKCIQFSAYYGGYAEYYLGCNYEKLVLTYAPGKDTREESIGIIEVYGDDVEGDLLYGSDEINYRSHSKTVTIDVSGCEFIRIKCGKNNKYGYVVVKGFVE